MTLAQILAAADAQGLGVSITRDRERYPSNLAWQPTRCGLWNAQFYTNQDGTDIRTCKFGATAEEAVEKAWAAFTPFAPRLPALAGPKTQPELVIENNGSGSLPDLNEDIPF